MTMRPGKPVPIYYPLRQWLVLGLLFFAMALLAARAVYLQIVARDYLQAQGSARYQRVHETAAIRGMILDRSGEPLAVSTPVDSIWGHPPTLLGGGHSWHKLAGLLGILPKRLMTLVKENGGREFVYLKRHLPPDAARRVLDLEIPGVELAREYRRYYPAGPVFGQVIGFTNIDDVGQEGIELTYEKQLTGIPGRTRVLRDRVGHVVEYAGQISPAVPGQDLTLSLDARIQYLAYRYLSAAVKTNRARGATLVALDSNTGEVLAMVSLPSFNPNNLRDRTGGRHRNRAVTDVFEPGSTIKPFTIAMALQSGVLPDTRVDTTPGRLTIGSHTIRDTKDYGLLTVSRVLIKSSNVGAAKIAMDLPVKNLVKVLRDAGFGETTGIRFPGEISGSLADRREWRPIEHATLAFGYGMSTTALQLARAYTVFATDGRLLPVSMIPVTRPPAGVRVLAPKIVREVRNMLEQVASDHGTAAAARVPRYRVAGKTGTVHKLVNGNYADSQYLSLFVGFAPVSDPRLIIAVMIDDPRGNAYYGGEVAAPVFSNVMSGALRLLNVAPDRPATQLQQAKALADGA